MTERVVARNGAIVPNAEQRQLAVTLYGTYVALVEVGFTEAAALAIVRATVSSVSTGAE